MPLCCTLNTWPVPGLGNRGPLKALNHKFAIIHTFQRSSIPRIWTLGTAKRHYQSPMFKNNMSRYEFWITYSDLPNNCAANIINFRGKKHLHNLSRTYKFINFWEFSFKTWFSPKYINEKKSFLHSLIKTSTRFWETCHLHD